jgi:hypothetical protein
MDGPFSRDELRHLLTRLGELLAADGESVAIVIVGGAALNLRGVVSRRTADVDVIAVGRGTGGRAPEAVEVPTDLPHDLAVAAARLARDLGLPPDWINATVGDHGRLVLPPGFLERVEWQRLGGLWLGLAGRWDLVALKLHAAVDTDIRSRHFADLVSLAPTRAELERAAAWVRTRDAGEGFSAMLDQVIRHVLADAE